MQKDALIMRLSKTDFGSFWNSALYLVSEVKMLIFKKYIQLKLLFKNIYTKV